MSTSHIEASRPVIYSRSEHPISRKNIDADALKIMRRLSFHGYKAYLVGGGVRDLVLGIKPKDFDIATDATPRNVKSLFRNCRIIGRRFKLAHIFFQGGKIIEVATFRADQTATESDSDNPTKDVMITHDNIYGDERTDAIRRDLTINALFYDLSSFSIIDYVGGMQDLRDGIVRMIGEPEQRFAEDPVRMLRVARHAARTGFRVDPACEGAIQKDHELITKSSTMRVYEEIKKDIASGNFAKSIRLLSQFKLLTHLIPELDHPQLLSEGSYFLRCLANADALMREDLVPGPTSILSLLTLFSMRPSLTAQDTESECVPYRELPTMVRCSFTKLSVPRRERESISDIIGLWQRIVSGPRASRELSIILRDRKLNEALLLLQFLDPDGRHESLLEFIDQARSEEGFRRNPRRRRQRRNRKPRGYGGIKL